jgi:hypothetical protein
MRLLNKIKAFILNPFEGSPFDLFSNDEEYYQYHAWVKIGRENNWITDPFCMTHDGDPYMEDWEEEEWNYGGDPCCPVFKIRY